MLSLISKIFYTVSIYIASVNFLTITGLLAWFQLAIEHFETHIEYEIFKKGYILPLGMSVKFL